MSAERGSALPVVRAGAGWVVIDKPAGMRSVPGRGPDKSDCAVARVAAMFPHATGPMVVHRLDMDTSGLMLVALDAQTQRALSMQFERREVNKRYVAIVEGAPEREAGVIHLKQRLDVDNRPRQIIDDQRGKTAETHWRVIESSDRGASVSPVQAWGAPSPPVRTRIEFIPITGRSHQLRIAAATPAPVGLGCPIVGDDLYGAGRAPGARMLLAAIALEFHEPATGSRVRVTLPSPF